LPYGTLRRPATAVAGGTVAEDKRSPWPLIAVPIGVMIVIALIAKGLSGSPDEPITASIATPTVAPQPQPDQPTAQVVEPTRPIQPAKPAAPDPSAALAELDRVLRGRRLWSTIETAASRIDLRSGLCDDPGMRPAIDSVAPVLRGAGLTRLRCLAQSGTVVLERDL